MSVFLDYYCCFYYSGTAMLWEESVRHKTQWPWVFCHFLKIAYFCLCWVFCCTEGYSLVLGRALSSRGARASVAAPRLQSAGSVVVAPGLSLCAACGIFPDQGSNPVLCVGRRILYHWAARETPPASVSIVYLNIDVDIRSEMYLYEKNKQTLSYVINTLNYWWTQSKYCFSEQSR